jgi:Flp pilus assembly protein CpaB
MNAVGVPHRWFIVREGEGPVKRQTVILVTIGVILFIAGGAIAFVSVANSNKTKTPTASTGAVSPQVVVATAAIPAGTTGQQMISSNLVAVQTIPAKNYVSSDLQSLTSLSNVSLNASIAKGQAISTTELVPTTSAISLPTGQDAVTVTVSGVNGLAGYLQPGSRVDVYATLSKSSQTQTGAWVPAGLTLPCTELTMTNIEVLDVSQTSPSLTGSKSATPATATSGGRTIPSSETLLLAVTPDQAQTVNYFTQNASLSVAQTQKGTVPPLEGICKGTGQYTVAP